MSSLAKFFSEVKSVTGPATSTPKKRIPSNLDQKADRELLAMYGEYVLEGDWDEEIGNDDDEPQAVKVMEGLDRSYIKIGSVPLGQQKSEDIVENTRSLQRLYDLNSEEPRKLIRRGGINFPNRLSTVKPIDDDDNDILFDAKDTDPALFLHIDPAGIAEQFRQLRTMDEGAEGKSDELVRDSDREFDIGVFPENTQPIRETVLDHAERVSPGHRKYKRRHGTMYFTAQNISDWTPEFRDYMCDKFNPEKLTNMGQFLVAKRVPRLLTLNSGYSYVNLSASELLWRRVEKWSKENAGKDQSESEGKTSLIHLSPDSEDHAGISGINDSGILIQIDYIPFYAKEQHSVVYSDNQDDCDSGSRYITPHVSNNDMSNTSRFAHIETDDCNPHYSVSRSTTIGAFETDLYLHIEDLAMISPLSQEQEALYRLDPDDEFGLGNLHRDGAQATSPYHEYLNSFGFLRVMNETSREEIDASRDLEDSDGDEILEVLIVSTNLDPIKEEDSEPPSSLTSDSSIDFSQHRGYIRPLENRRLDFLEEEESEVLSKALAPESSTFDDLFFNRIWWTQPDLSLRMLELFEPTKDDSGSEASKDSQSAVEMEGIPSITIEPPIDDTVDRTSSLKCIQTSLLYPSRNNSYGLHQSRILLRQILEDHRRHRESQARLKISKFEKDIADYLQWLFEQINEGVFRDLPTIYADAEWAFNVLWQADPYSSLISSLDLAICVLWELIGSSNWLDPHNDILEADTKGSGQIWGAMWSPNTVAETEDDLTAERNGILHGLTRLKEECLPYPKSDDPYRPFSLWEAQVKFMLWNEEDAEPSSHDPDYSLLTQAQEISTSLFEAQIDVILTIRSFTDDYIHRITSGNIDYMDEVRSTILDEFDPNSSSKIENSGLGYFCDRVVDLYQTWRIGPMIEGERTVATVLAALEEYKSCIKELKFRLQLITTPSLQADNTYHLANRFWKTCLACMEDIEKAHNEPYLNSSNSSFTLSSIELENLMWCDWINHMYKVLNAVEDFEGKIHSSFLPSVNDFLIDSLSWWESKIYQKIRHVRRGQLY
ncbi:hypothetical protein CC78DRAFT_620936 [Lojkania enalia]|uniref:Uncharacterized protein n=1 Tax=Lojkania enalia TaxID=147567 RepID=A0A9P4K057_9PLEO|nr:hypothetical protein CC78DRAFT_620936 [Didymosphaeria enalia]